MTRNLIGIWMVLLLAASTAWAGPAQDDPEAMVTLPRPEAVSSATLEEDEVEIFINRQRRRDFLLHRLGLYSAVAVALAGMAWGGYELVQWAQHRSQAEGYRALHNEYVGSSSELSSTTLADLRAQAQHEEDAASGASTRAGVGLGVGGAALMAAIVLLIVEPSVPAREAKPLVTPALRPEGGGEVQLSVTF